MGMIQRAWTVIKSQLNALIGRAEDPRKLIEQALLDMADQLAKTKERVAAAIADEKKLNTQLEQQRQLAADWESRAVLALNQGREDLAKQALTRQAEHQQNAEQLAASWQQHAQATTALRESLKSLYDRVEELKRKKDVLLARHARVQAQRQINDTLSSIQDPSAASTFARMEEKIADMERQASAAVALASELNGDSLEQQFKALEQRDAADERLLALKQKLGMSSAKQLGTGAKVEIVEAVVDESERG